MRWPETEKLIKCIRRERPELTAQAHASPGSKGHFLVRAFCARKAGREIVAGSEATFHRPSEWLPYKLDHPEPFCSPAL